MLENLKGLWDERDAERGVALGLIVGTIFAAVSTESDWMAMKADRDMNRTPYGVLWVLFNWHFWIDLDYRIWTTFLLFAAEGFMYFAFVRRGQLSKFLFYAGWLQSLIWMRGTVYQNVTVTMLAPLASIMPFTIVTFMVLQKLPIGWSLIPWESKNWWCAFVGNNGFVEGEYIVFENGQKLILCPGGWFRWNPEYAWFWSYMMIAFWVIMPVLFYEKAHGWKHFYWFLRLVRMKPGTWEYYNPLDFDTSIQHIAKLHFPSDLWFCSLCRKDVEVDIGNGFWFDGEFLCWDCMEVRTDE